MLPDLGQMVRPGGLLDWWPTVKGVQMNKSIVAVFFLGMLILGARQFRAVVLEKERKAGIAQAAADLKASKVICEKFGNTQIWVDCLNEVGDALADGRK